MDAVVLMWLQQQHFDMGFGCCCNAIDEQRAARFKREMTATGEKYALEAKVMRSPSQPAW